MENVKCPFCGEPRIKQYRREAEFSCGTIGPDESGDYVTGHICDTHNWSRVFREQDVEIKQLKRQLADALAAAKRYEFVKRQYVQTHSPHMDGTRGFRFSHGWPPLNGSTFDEAVDLAMMMWDKAAEAGGDRG